MRLVFIAALLSIIISTSSFGQRTEFSGSNAEAILRTLVLDIGPRPMGSPAEQRALEFAVSKFNEYGCDTSYILPFTVAQGVNTRSGVAVGVKKGKTGRIIVIGGHIDTSGPDVPGANDDGSGTACVIELARVIAKRETESTILFCCWGGEETGLNGSKYFVRNFPLIDSVVLMLQIDMADGASYLIADPDGGKTNGPAWLLRAAFDEFYNTLQYEGLEYHTISSTLNMAVGGAFGSDHIPFIEEGIPAIDFTSDVSFPIHTPLDAWENFTPSGLQRSGDLVLRLFERFDGGVPSRETAQYQVIQIGSRLIILPFPLLWGWIVLALALAVAAFFVGRKRRVAADATPKVRWSGFKVLLVAFVLQTAVWGSESLFGLFTGYRFGWVGNGWGYILLGLLSGVVALWLMLMALRRFRLTDDAFVYERVALIMLFVFTVLASIPTPRLGFIFAIILGLVSLAFVFKSSALKWAFLTGAGLVMLRLIFFETQTLFQRGVTQSTQASLLPRVISEMLPIIACGVLTLPLVYAFVAVYRSSGRDLFFMKQFRSKPVLASSLAGLVFCGGYLYTRVPYDNLWHSNVRVEQKLLAGRDSLTIEIRGSERLKNLRGVIGAVDTLLDADGYELYIPRVVPEAASWLRMSNSSSLGGEDVDSMRTLSKTLNLQMRVRPLRVELTFASDQPFEVKSGWELDTGIRGIQRLPPNTKRFTWYAYPDSLLSIPVTFTLNDSQLVRQELRVMLDSPIYPIHLRRDLTSFSYRTIITARDTFGVEAGQMTGGDN